MSSHQVHLPSLLSKVVRRHRSFAQKKHISITMKDVPDVTLAGDEGHLEKLFSNIIANAVSYGKEKGAVHVSGSVKKGEVSIAIRDNGIGIPKKDLPHIFERFYRVDSSRSKDYGGTGLGLAIVKWIAEAHGGTVSATSTPQKGSVFTITFPLK
jgi:signal transduction histidine kinase